MGRPRLKPHLYLDPTRKQWAIRDGQRFLRTGLTENDENAAETALQKYLNRKRKIRRIGNIYFVTCEVEAFPIKIGMSTNIQERMRDIRTSLPFPVILLATTEGDSIREASIQRQFNHLRMNGEWFRRADDLMSFIEDLDTISVHQQCHR